MSKHAYIFDLDDTLIKSKSLIYVYNQNSELIDKINSEDYVKKRGVIADYYKSGYKVDTTEFGGLGNCLLSDKSSYDFLYNGVPLQKQLNILKEMSERNNVDIYIVTGRANKPESIKQLIYEKFGVSILLNNIYPVGNKEKMDLLWYKLNQNENDTIMNVLKNGHNATNFKKAALYDILRKKYDYVTFYDDDPENIDCFNNLINELNNIGFNMKSNSYLVK
jgi:hypothetical protein